MKPPIRISTSRFSHSNFRLCYSSSVRLEPLPSYNNARTEILIGNIPPIYLAMKRSVIGQEHRSFNIAGSAGIRVHYPVLALLIFGQNIVEAIDLAAPNDEDVLLELDGDDWFSSPESLSIIAKAYEDPNCWLTYGSYIEYPSRQRGKFAKPIPEHIINGNSYRKAEWMTSQQRTFKAHLWNRINKKDLLDSEGNYYKMVKDLAIMFPMLEMAGFHS